jgi:hypothetical protein
MGKTNDHRKVGPDTNEEAKDCEEEDEGSSHEEEDDGQDQ